jgi:hypothetical protein
MWDAKIKQGRWEYGDSLLRMHSLAVRIRDELAPEEARDDIDGYLQRTGQEASNAHLDRDKAPRLMARSCPDGEQDPCAGSGDRPRSSRHG